MTERFDLTPAALYARVSSDRQDVDLSIAAQLRALRDYAEKNDYPVAREYVDEAESGRIADRPEFQKMLNEANKPEAPFKEILIRRKNSDVKLRYSWAVDLGPFKLGRFAGQQRAPQQPAEDGGGIRNGDGARPSEHTEAC